MVVDLNINGYGYVSIVVAKSASVLARSFPQVKPQDVGRISTFEYTAQDGTQLDGILTLPPHSEHANLPVILLPGSNIIFSFLSFNSSSIVDTKSSGDGVLSLL